MLLTPAILEVKTFGEFSISRRTGDEALVISESDNYSKKLWVLLEYLVVFRKRGASKAELTDLFWDGESNENPENNLKALIFRARNTLELLGLPSGKAVILYQNGSYRFTRELIFRVDFEQFDLFCTAAEASEAADKRLNNSLAAIHLYEGDFLPKSSDYSWAATLNIYYHSKYLKLCADSILLLEKAERHDEIIELCKKALTIEPYDEALYRSLIKAFAASGAMQAAQRQYTYAVDLFISKLSVPPSRELTELYSTIKPDDTGERDLDSVWEALREKDNDPAPYFCEYAVFKNICRLNARASERSGEPVQLVMLTLSGKGRRSSDRQTAAGMDYLMQSIRAALRSSDVFTKYSSRQYLLLLSSAGYEDGQKTVNRILRHFLFCHPRVGYTVKPSLFSLPCKHWEEDRLVENALNQSEKNTGSASLI